MHGTFGSSQLVRLLGDGVAPEAQAPGMDFAERLSLWLSAFDAIGLQAGLQAIRAIETAAAPDAPRPRGARTPGVAEDLQRVRTVLAKAIAQDPLAGAAEDAAYSPFHQRHLELQRQMEQMIGALREHVRHALARVSPRLRQLAALDAALEQVLAAREHALQPTVPALLKRRFEQLRASGTTPGAFVHDWQQALLAELDLRLQPVTGLVEALNNEMNDRR